MEKIVSKGLKIDLHIHSKFSSKKDGKKVAENTIENLPVLIEKLEVNDVGMCAITDHDIFNYNLYKKLKEEESKDNCIKKVLPGIEFSVEFEKNKEIHIVTIFDDKDDKKVEKIEEIMTKGIGKEKYHEGKYTRQDYFDILDSIAKLLKKEYELLKNVSHIMKNGKRYDLDYSGDLTELRLGYNCIMDILCNLKEMLYEDIMYELY